MYVHGIDGEEGVFTWSCHVLYNLIIHCHTTMHSALAPAVLPLTHFTSVLHPQKKSFTHLQSCCHTLPHPHPPISVISSETCSLITQHPLPHPHPHPHTPSHTHTFPTPHITPPLPSHHSPMSAEMCVGPAVRDSAPSHLEAVLP